MPTHLPSPSPIANRHVWIVAVMLCLIAMTVRLPMLGQSLWYDEMYTLLNYVWTPWENLLRGENLLREFSPNNHPFYSILAKLIVPEEGVHEIVLRIPSLLAGSLLGLVLAWPIRRSHPATAVLIGILSSLQPWLATFGSEARGYALMLLLCMAATNCLPSKPGLIDLRYAALMAAALYTIPISATLIVGHGIAICILRREALIRWGISSLVAIGAAAIFYCPASGAMARYLAEPHQPSLPYSQLLPAMLMSLLRGYNASTNSAMRWGLGILAVALLALGTAHCLRKRLLLPHVISLAVAAFIAAFAPLIVPSAGEARFLIWVAPWFCIAAAAPLSVGLEKTSSSNVWRARAQGALLLVVFAAPLGFLWMIPAQPIRNGVQLARQEAKRTGGPVIGIYMAAAEANAVYGDIDAIVYELPALRKVEFQAKGTIPVAVVFYESFLQRDQPALYDYLHSNYALVQDLPGRVSAARIYRRLLP